MLIDILDVLSLEKRLYDKIMQPVCDSYSITRMELDIMLFLANNSGYDTASDIIERRHLTKSHVSSSIKSLEERGYLEKSFKEGSRKAICLKLKEPAVAVIADGRKAQKEFFAHVTKNLTSDEINVLDDVFSKIVISIRAAL